MRRTNTKHYYIRKNLITWLHKKALSACGDPCLQSLFLTHSVVFIQICANSLLQYEYELGQTLHRIVGDCFSLLEYQMGGVIHSRDKEDISATGRFVGTCVNPIKMVLDRSQNKHQELHTNIWREVCDKQTVIKNITGLSQRESRGGVSVLRCPANTVRCVPWPCH